MSRPVFVVRVAKQPESASGVWACPPPKISLPFFGIVYLVTFTGVNFSFFAICKNLYDYDHEFKVTFSITKYVEILTQSFKTEV
jgi:hypothetical protein